jgi:hypothetical protein
MSIQERRPLHISQACAAITFRRSAPLQDNSMHAANLAVALELAQAGIPIFPARFIRRFNGWEKKPAIKDWQTLATTDPGRIQSWFAQFPYAVAGIEMGRAGLVAIDADRHRAGPDGQEAYAQLVCDTGPPLPHPTTDTPSNGNHHIFRTPPGVEIGTSPGALPSGIDVRGRGGWIVAPGAIRPDGVAYSASNGSPGLAAAYRAGTIPELPAPFVRLITDGPRSNGKDDTAETSVEQTAEPVDVELALADMRPGNINATHCKVVGSMLSTGVPYGEIVETVVDATMKVAAAHGLTDWTRDEEVKFVTRCMAGLLKTRCREDTTSITGDAPPVWVAPELQPAWSEIVRSGGRPNIVWRKDFGWHIRDMSKVWRDGPPHDREPNNKDARRNHNEPQSSTNAPPKIRFRLLSFSDLKPGPEPLYLVDELIPIAGLVDVWGKAKCYKSFWCLDVMLHVAMGWEYRDRSVRQGAVVYCAFEGAHGYKKRIEALRRRYPIAPEAHVPLYVMPGQANLIQEHRTLIADIRAQLGDTTPAAVVLDTLNKSLHGSESKDEDMSKYIRAAEAIRDAFGCVVIIVHHCGWDDTRPRGHSSLPGAVDAQLSITRIDDQVTVTVEMMRDGPEDTVVTSVALVVDVGTDEKGKLLTSLVLIPAEAQPYAAESKKWPRTLATFFAAAKDAIATHGTPFQTEAGTLPVRAVDIEAIRYRFYEAYVDGEENEKKAQNARRQAFKRGLQEAQQRDIVHARAVKGRTMVWFREHPA